MPLVARWALGAYAEILHLVSPMRRPAVVALSTHDRPGAPRPIRQAPMLEIGLLCDLEKVEWGHAKPTGMRFYASALALIVFASLRCSD